MSNLSLKSSPSITKTVKKLSLEQQINIMKDQYNLIRDCFEVAKRKNKELIDEKNRLLLQVEKLKRELQKEKEKTELYEDSDIDESEISETVKYKSIIAYYKDCLSNDGIYVMKHCRLIAPHGICLIYGRDPIKRENYLQWTTPYSGKYRRYYNFSVSHHSDKRKLYVHLSFRTIVLECMSNRDRDIILNILGGLL